MNFNFSEAGDFVTQHALPLLGAGWGVAMLAGAVKFYVIPKLQPKRPIKHTKEYLEAKERADATMARLGLD